MVRLIFVGLLCSAVAFGQSDSSNKPSAPNSRSEKGPASSKSVKAESVTINMPEGMTKDQADAILTELKAIHQLLQTQQNTRAAAPAAAPAPAPSDKVKMSVGTGWYAMGREDAPVTMVEFTD